MLSIPSSSSSCSNNINKPDKQSLSSSLESYDKPRQCIKKTETSLHQQMSIVKGMVFSVVMYGCESWTIKKAEHWRIYGF